MTALRWWLFTRLSAMVWPQTEPLKGGDDAHVCMWKSD